MLSVVVAIGTALAVPAPRQLLALGPITREVLDARGISWDNAVVEGDEENQSATRFKNRANDLIESILQRKHKESIISRSTDGLSFQKLYGTGKRFEKDAFSALRDSKYPARNQAFDSPLYGSALHKGRDAGSDSKPPTQLEAVGLPPHDGRAVDEHHIPIRHTAKRGWGQDFPSTRQEETAEASTWKGQNKNWKKDRSSDWLRILGQDESPRARRRENIAGSIKMKGRGKDWSKISPVGTEDASDGGQDTKKIRRQELIKRQVSDVTARNTQQEGPPAGETDWGRQVRKIVSRV